MLGAEVDIEDIETVDGAGWSGGEWAGV